MLRITSHFLIYSGTYETNTRWILTRQVFGPVVSITSCSYIRWIILTLCVQLEPPALSCMIWRVAFPFLSPNSTHSESPWKKEKGQQTKFHILGGPCSVLPWGCQLSRSPPNVFSSRPHVGTHSACGGHIITARLQPIKSPRFHFWARLLLPQSLGLKNSPRSCLAQIKLLYFFNLALPGLLCQSA